MSFTTPDRIRCMLSQAMSDMFRAEVPAYGVLIDIVEQVNAETLLDNTALRDALTRTDGIDRISAERHGAIRLGTAKELATMRRLFAIMGMFPVGYYDLSEAAIPVHATAFRPLSRAALAVNPFRVFTSLLRLELIANTELRVRAEEILSKRKIFTDEALSLISQAETDGGLNDNDSESLVSEALETFRWHGRASVDAQMFERLLAEHRLVADVVSFRGPHINHLTPRTLDIDEVQVRMPKYGIDPKAVIEGPPRRDCPILLRQTSFKALTEPVSFINEAGEWIEQSHTARFGEVEQRGVALTRKGRSLYDRLLAKLRSQIQPDAAGKNAEEYVTKLSEVFAEFPDNWDDMRRQELAYFEYALANGSTPLLPGSDIEAAIVAGTVAYSPIIYEDFLPVSAAGIFQSNLGDEHREQAPASADQRAFLEALGCDVVDEFGVYQTIETDSIRACFAD